MIGQPHVRRGGGLLAGLAMTLLIGCGGESAQDQVDAAQQTAPVTPAPAAPAPATPGNEVATEYAPTLNVDLSQMTSTASGLYYQVLREGAGEAVQAGDPVRVQYTGWLPNGEKFESGTYSLTIGAGQAIKGWDEGLVGMKPGEKRRLIIPPALGYGERGSPGVIPPYATLVFDIELPN